MSAIRLARGFTRRDKIIKFDGCYHGHVDSLLVKAGSGALTFGQPDSAGVPAAFTQHTVVLPFNDVDAVKAAFAANSGQIAGIIVEPVPGNLGTLRFEMTSDLSREHLSAGAHWPAAFRFRPVGKQDTKTFRNKQIANIGFRYWIVWLTPFFPI